MITIVDFDFLFDLSTQRLNVSNCRELVSEMKSNFQFGVMFTISSINELKDENLKHIKQNFKTFQESLKVLELELSCKREKKFIEEVEIYLLIQVDIESLQFRDKELLFIRKLKENCDMLSIRSYSNTMLEQIISKKVTHMIINVFSQKIVSRYDFIHHFNSGINHVLCNEMSNNSMFLGVELHEFSIISSLKQSKYFSSCIQNSQLATKSKVPHLVFKIIRRKEDIRSQRELMSFQKAFMRSQPYQIKQQINFLELFLSKQKRIKKGEYVE